MLYHREDCKAIFPDVCRHQGHNFKSLTKCEPSLGNDAPFSVLGAAIKNVIFCAILKPYHFGIYSYALRTSSMSSVDIFAILINSFVRVLR